MTHPSARLSRRRFNKAAGLGLGAVFTGSLFRPRSSWARSGSLGQIAVQLWSVRKEIEKEAAARHTILMLLRKTCNELRSRYDAFLSSKDCDNVEKRDDWVYIMEYILRFQQEREEYLYQHGSKEYYQHYNGRGHYHVKQQLYAIIGNTKELVALVEAGDH